ncbi:MAG: hypothetical protein EBS92_01490 [Proteobacteria bacterium]|nr:hypothetical protein [Pseudomonadota bacterium]
MQILPKFYILNLLLNLFLYSGIGVNGRIVYKNIKIDFQHFFKQNLCKKFLKLKVEFKIKFKVIAKFQ